jgi:hypothetical protein
MITAEQAEIRDLARDFARRELRPHTLEWDTKGDLDPGVVESLAELGFLGMSVPEELGGLGLDRTTRALVVEALAWGDPAVARAVALHSAAAGAVGTLGGEELRESWAPRLASGEVLAGVVVPRSERGRGPLLDPRARPEDEAPAVSGEDGWIVEGVQAHVPLAGSVGLLVVLAPTAVEAGVARSTRAFVLEASAEGVAMEETPRPMGFLAADSRLVCIDGVEPGPGAVLSPDRPSLPVTEILDETRLGMAAVSLGIAQAALEHALAYGAEREQFGRSISSFGAIQFKLAEMAARIAASRALTLEVSEGEGEETWGTPEPPGPASRIALAKLTASEAAMEVADEAVQIFGGYGYMRDYPVEKLMRDAKGTEIYEEPNGLMRTVVSLELVRASRPDTG